MRFNISKFLFPSFNRNKSTKDELINEVIKDFIDNGRPKTEREYCERLSKILTQNQLDEIIKDLPAAYEAAYAKDILENGIPVTELDNVASAIVYLYFDGIIYESDEAINRFKKEIQNNSFNKKTITKIIELESYISNSLLNIKEEISSDELLDLIPYYLLQNKFGDQTPQIIEDTKEWIKTNKDNYLHQSLVSDSNHFTLSAWLEGETPPHKKPEYRKMQKINTESGRRVKDPIAGGRPKEILIAPRPELQEDFGWWSLKLFFLLSIEYRATEFINSKEYDEVAFVIGKRCLDLMPNAREYLTKKPNPHNYDQLFSFKENKGLVLYVKLLIKYDKLEDALIVCEECIKYGVHDGTKTGFSGRAKIIINKITKQEPKQKLTKQDNLDSKISGGNGALNDEKILEMVARYLSSSRQDRQLLPAEYGITRTNMYYLVSKNKHLLEKKHTL